MNGYSVYVIYDPLSGWSKVGMAKDWGRRSSNYKTHNPRAEVALAMTLANGDAEDAKLVEIIAMYILDGYRVSGEWFDCHCVIVREALQEACNIWHSIANQRKKAFIDESLLNETHAAEPACP